MKTCESDTHIALPKSSGIVDVYTKSKSTIVETQITEDGVREVVYTADNAPQSLIHILKAFDEVPVLKFAKSRTGGYFVEYKIPKDGRVAQWVGKKPLEEVIEILEEYKFSASQIKAIFSACNRFEHERMSKGK